MRVLIVSSLRTCAIVAALLHASSALAAPEEDGAGLRVVSQSIDHYEGLQPAVIRRCDLTSECTPYVVPYDNIKVQRRDDRDALIPMVLAEAPTAASVCRQG